MNRYGSIYKIVNIINQKVYIGQTVQSIKRRWKQHLRSNHCSAVSLAIAKYGTDNFMIEELCCAGDKEELDRLEQLFINEYSSLAPTGYNLKEGGNSNRHNAATKLKMSATRKCNPKLWINLIDRDRSISEETKRKIGRSNTGKVRSPITRVKLGKSVVRLTLDNQFDKFYATLSCATSDGFLRTAISNVLSGKAETHRKYKWRYATSEEINLFLPSALLTPLETSP